MSLVSKEKQFKDNPFTQTPGYKQYVHPDESRSEARQKGIKQFLLDDDSLEPSIMMDGRFDSVAVQEAV